MWTVEYWFGEGVKIGGWCELSEVRCGGRCLVALGWGVRVEVGGWVRCGGCWLGELGWGWGVEVVGKYGG